MRCARERARFAYVAPFYRQAKTVAWDYAKHYTRALPERKVNEAELRVDFLGERRITLYGADNPDSLRGLYFDGVVLDEFAQMDPRVWGEIVRPALADRRGWAIFIGTPQGRDAFWTLYDGALNGFVKTESDGSESRIKDDDWYPALFKASETGILPSEEIAAMRRVMSEEEAEQELECSFQAAIRGAYYGKLIYQAETETPPRIGRVPYEPKLRVTTAWDLGSANMVIWFCQTLNSEVRLIDYCENQHMGLDYYAKVLSQKPYAYAEHLLPHDVEVKELGTGTSRLETLRSLGIGNIRVLPQITTTRGQEVQDGIAAVKALLPRCWFDAEKCARGLEALRHYRSEYNEERKTFSDAPLHDWASHAADAFRYLARGLRPAGDARFAVDPQTGRMPKINYPKVGVR